jgi:hypothetical protein
MNPPVRFSAFFPLKNTGFYREEDEAELLSYQFLLVNQAAYLYNHKAVVAVQVNILAQIYKNILNFCCCNGNLL